MLNLICMIKGHDWIFGYNHGIPPGCSNELWTKLWKDGTAFEVHQCKRCGIYDAPSDGLNPNVKYGSGE